MKTSEIKVGEHYAHGRGKYSSRTRVKVLETGLPEQFGYRSTRNTGVRVEWQAPHYRVGQQTTVSSRDIVRLWSEQELRNESARQASEERAERVARELAEHANFAARLDRVLSAHGVEAKSAYVYRANQREALKAAGLTVDTDERVLTRVTDLNELISQGRVSLKDAGYLLADVEAAWAK